jgi:dihydrofolate reductase
MSDRLIAPIAGIDQNGVFGIGSYLPWSNETGRSAIKLDMGRLVLITRNTLFAPDTKNILIMGRGTFDSIGKRSLPGRRTVVVSQTLTEHEVNLGRADEDRIAIAQNIPQAVARALQFKDCGHIFLFGGETVWLEGLKSGLCNAAFITIVMCDSVAMSPHKNGLVRRLPELLRDETFTGMVCERVPMTDMWGAAEVQLEFCNYTKPQQA